jgi:hypothetical protein
MTVFPQMIQPGAGRRKNRVVAEYQASPLNSGNSSSYNFTSQPFGTADSNRRIGVMGFIIGDNGSNMSLSSMTIGGVSATIEGQFTFNWPSSDECVFFCQALVPTGTTGTVSVSCSTGSFRCALSIYAIYNCAPTPIVDVQANDQYYAAGGTTTTPSLNVSPYSAVIGFYYGFCPNGAPDWDNIADEDFDKSGEGSTARYTGASELNPLYGSRVLSVSRGDEYGGDLIVASIR